MEPTIYKTDSIYRQGLSEKDVKEIISKSYKFSFTLLTKYQNKIDAIDIKSIVKPNIFLSEIDGSFHANTSFYPAYDSNDGGGDTDWPMIAYADIDPELLPGTIGGYFSITGFSEQINYQFTIRKQTGKLEFRLPHAKNVNAVWHVLSSGIVVK